MLLRHLSGLFGREGIQKFIERNWIAQPFYVPLYIFANDETSDLRRVDFLANFARDHDLVLLEQPRDITGEENVILGVKSRNLI